MAGIAGLILAGGAARRMGGGDKALLEIGGRPILERIIARVRPEVARLAISANGEPARLARFACPVLPDPPPFAGQGPLAGLCAGLDWAAEIGAEALLSVPGDTPFLPAGLAGALAPAPSFAACAGRDHPLVALWPVSCRAELRARLEGEAGRAVAGFAAAIGARRRTFAAELAPAFLNLNTPADLRAARARAAGGAPGNPGAAV